MKANAGAALEGAPWERRNSSPSAGSRQPDAQDDVVDAGYAGAGGFVAAQAVLRLDHLEQAPSKAWGWR
jgi:hypothetical protein